MRSCVVLGGVAAATVISGSAFAADAIRPSLIAPAPAAVAAVSPVSGYIELYGIGAWSEPGWGTAYDPWKGGGGAARANIWLQNNMSAQLDFSGQFVAPNYYGGYYDATTISGALHVSERNANHLLGIFGGVAATSDYYGEYGLDTSVFGGAEAQHYVGPVTIYGQVGYDHQFNGYYGSYYSGYNFNYLFGQLEGRYFLTSNTELSANIGFVNGKVFGTTDGPARTYLTFGAQIEQKFGSSPLSVFARAEGLSVPSSAIYPGTSYTIAGGIKFSWNAMSLMDQDRHGATLKIMQDLTPFSWLRTNDEY